MSRDIVVMVGDVIDVVGCRRSRYRVKEQVYNLGDARTVLVECDDYPTTGATVPARAVVAVNGIRLSPEAK